MSYTANQYNHCTPLSSTAGLVAPDSVVVDKKYFTLHDNKLDGSYFPVSGDVGLWGAVVSDNDGTLSSPFVITVSEEQSMSAVRIVGSEACYPVAFTVEFYSGSTLLHTITETANNRWIYIGALPQSLAITSYTISITKISAANSVARLYNTYNPPFLKRYDRLGISQTSKAVVSLQTVVLRNDTVVLQTRDAEASHIRNTINKTFDTLDIAQPAKAVLTNVHSRMKDPSRRIYGKVYITYTDPLLNSEHRTTSNLAAYNSNMEQLYDGNLTTEPNYFTLYENDLTGSYVVSDQYSQVGWYSAILSNADGTFDVNPYVQISFSARPIVALTVTFDDSRSNLVQDFTALFTREDGSTVLRTFTGNADKTVSIVDESISDVVSITITVQRIARGGYPAVILDIPVSSTVLYKGYQDASDLMSIDLLEELTYEDEVEALGGVSANEITVVLDNSAKAFMFNNRQSLVASQLKRNRKIEPWLGTEIAPGEIEWYKLGTFWSYKWDIPVNGLTASVVGFDTIGLLGITSYTDHQVQIDKSIGELIEYVLDDAAKQLEFIEYKIDEALYDIIIPYAWFDASSHAAALRKISLCYPMHIYCDRDGRICAAPQKLRLDYYYDTWADNTNVISKSYSSLRTTVPNVVKVTVKAPTVATDNNLASDKTGFVVSGTVEKTLTFSKAYLSDIALSIDCDDTVTYTYATYSWGIVLTFTGSGTVRTIECAGTYVEASDSTVVSWKDHNSIRLNGMVTRDIASDFIQTQSLAEDIVARIASVSEYDRYDVSVDYRGDIALSINDPILLLGGIAPDNRYNIKRHELSWNGALTGSADLNA